MSFHCTFCGHAVDPTAPTTLQRVEGWERRAFGASRRGGSDIVLRTKRDVFACSNCIERAKMGVPAAQESLSL